VTAERPMIDGAQNLMAQSRVKLQQVTTIPEAVLNLLRQITSWKKHAVRTIVHFAGARVHIMFAQDGALLLSREVHFDSAEMEQDEQAARLANELRRSMLYFRQNFPHTQPDQIVFSGDHDVLGAFATRASEELGMPGSILRFDDHLDISGFRGNWDEFRFHLSSLTAAIGAAWRKTPGIGINLLPGKTQAKQEAGLNLPKAARAACVIAAVIAVVTTLYFFREMGRIAALRTELNQRAAIVDPRLQQLMQLETSRSLAQQRSEFLKRIETHTDWTEVFRRISFIVPPTAVFEEMRVDGGDTSKVTMRGYVLAPSAAEGNADFNRFFNALTALSLFKNVTMPKPTVVVSVADAATANTGRVTSVAVQSSRVTFEVVCELP
jgi:Tfp pilus assembly protein PilN